MPKYLGAYLFPRFADAQADATVNWSMAWCPATGLWICPKRRAHALHVHVEKSAELLKQAIAAEHGVAPNAAALAQIVIDFARKAISFRSADLVSIQRMVRALGIPMDRHGISDLLRLGSESSFDLTAATMLGHGGVVRAWIGQDSCTTRNFHETNVVQIGYLLGLDGTMVEELVSCERVCDLHENAQQLVKYAVIHAARWTRMTADGPKTIMNGMFSDNAAVSKAASRKLMSGVGADGGYHAEWEIPNPAPTVEGVPSPAILLTVDVPQQAFIAQMCWLHAFAFSMCKGNAEIFARALTEDELEKLRELDEDGEVIALLGLDTPIIRPADSPILGGALNGAMEAGGIRDVPDRGMRVEPDEEEIVLDDIFDRQVNLADPARTMTTEAIEALRAEMVLPAPTPGQTHRTATQARNAPQAAQVGAEGEEEPADGRGARTADGEALLTGNRGRTMSLLLLVHAVMALLNRNGIFARMIRLIGKAEGRFRHNADWHGSKCNDTRVGWMGAVLESLSLLQVVMMIRAILFEGWLEAKHREMKSEFAKLRSAFAALGLGTVHLFDEFVVALQLTVAWKVETTCEFVVKSQCRPYTSMGSVVFMMLHETLNQIIVWPHLAERRSFLRKPAKIIVSGMLKYLTSLGEPRLAVAFMATLNPLVACVFGLVCSGGPVISSEIAAWNTGRSDSVFVQGLRLLERDMLRDGAPRLTADVREDADLTARASVSSVVSSLVELRRLGGFPLAPGDAGIYDERVLCEFAELRSEMLDVARHRHDREGLALVSHWSERYDGALRKGLLAVWIAISVYKCPLITAAIEGTISRLGRINQPSRSGKLAAATVEAELWANLYPNQAFVAIAQVVQKLHGPRLSEQNDRWMTRYAKRAERASRPLPGPWEVDAPNAQEILDVIDPEDIEPEEFPSQEFLAMIEHWLFMSPEDAARFAAPLWRLPAPQFDSIRALPPRLVREVVWRIERLYDQLPTTVSAYCRRVLEHVSLFTDANGDVNYERVWTELLDGEEPIAPAIDDLLLKRVAWTPRSA
jgi:hypothetical protein